MKLIANLKNLDSQATQQYGIPSLLLMESAGQQVAQALTVLPNITVNSSIVLACGRGNNGGDGFVAARHLALLGFQNITVLQARAANQGQAGPLQEDAHLNAELLKAYPIRVLNVTQTQAFSEALEAILQADLLVDALFGSGLSRPVDKTSLEYLLIEALNAKKALTVAVDLPSGIEATTGQVLGSAVQADLTLTFTASKPGLHLYPGKAFAGDVQVLDIGIPQELLTSNPSSASLLMADPVASWLPQRDPQGHKYSFGSVLVVAGSRNMPGAAVMAAEAALRAGAGIVTLAAPQSLFQQIPLMPEIVRLPLPETPAGTLASDAFTTTLLDKLEQATTLLIGPGLGQSPEILAFVQQALQALWNNPKTVVIDADGLNALSQLLQQKVFSEPLPSQFILTPHVGEFSRLTGVSKAEILQDLLKAATQGQQQLGGTLVLKSATSLVADPEGKLWINSTGNTGMATAGSGDVLAGLIAGLAAQDCLPEKAAPEKAAIVGVFLHGLAGDIAAAAKTPYAMVATDITHALPQAFHQLLSRPS